MSFVRRPLESPTRQTRSSTRTRTSSGYKSSTFKSPSSSKHHLPYSTTTPNQSARSRQSTDKTYNLTDDRYNDKRIDTRLDRPGDRLYHKLSGRSYDDSYHTSHGRHVDVPHTTTSANRSFEQPNPTSWTPNPMPTSTTRASHYDLLQGHDADITAAQLTANKKHKSMTYLGSSCYTLPDQSQVEEWKQDYVVKSSARTSASNTSQLGTDNHGAFDHSHKNEKVRKSSARTSTSLSPQIGTDKPEALDRSFTKEKLTDEMEVPQHVCKYIAEFHKAALEKITKLCSFTFSDVGDTDTKIEIKAKSEDSLQKAVDDFIDHYQTVLYRVSVESFDVPSLLNQKDVISGLQSSFRCLASPIADGKLRVIYRNKDKTSIKELLKSLAKEAKSAAIKNKKDKKGKDSAVSSSAGSRVTEIQPRIQQEYSSLPDQSARSHHQQATDISNAANKDNGLSVNSYNRRPAGDKHGDIRSIQSPDKGYAKSPDRHSNDCDILRPDVPNSKTSGNRSFQQQSPRSWTPSLVLTATTKAFHVDIHCADVHGYLVNNRIQVLIYPSDITRVAVDAVVNSVGPDLRLHGAIAGAISRAGGPDIQAECDRILTRQGLLRECHVVRTKAGKMPAKMVLHVFGPAWNPHSVHEQQSCLAKLQETFHNILIMATQASIQTIAIPPIGSGVHGIPGQYVTEILFQVIRDVARSTTPLREIHFVDLSPAILELLSKQYERCVLSGDKVGVLDRTMMLKTLRERLPTDVMAHFFSTTIGGGASAASFQHSKPDKQNSHADVQHLNDKSATVAQNTEKTSSQSCPVLDSGISTSDVTLNISEMSLDTSTGALPQPTAKYEINLKNVHDTQPSRPPGSDTEQYVDARQHLKTRLVSTNHDTTEKPRVPSAAVPPFSVNDHIKLNVTTAKLKVLQRGHGGWNSRMTEAIGLIGLLTSIDDNGDLCVKFPQGTYTLNPEACISLNPFSHKAMAYGGSSLSEVQPGTGPETQTSQQPQSSEVQPGTGPETQTSQQPQSSDSEYQCQICMEDKIRVVFNCGHGTCAGCAKSLERCHICRNTIAQKTNMFLS